MGVAPLIFIGYVLVFVVLALSGVILSKRLGQDYYREIILPKLQVIVKIFGGRLFEGTLDPEEWKTDRRSLLLLFIGLPLGIVLLMLIFSFVSSNFL